MQNKVLNTFLGMVFLVALGVVVGCGQSQPPASGYGRPPTSQGLDADYDHDANGLNDNDHDGI